MPIGNGGSSLGGFGSGRSLPYPGSCFSRSSVEAPCADPSPREGGAKAASKSKFVTALGRNPPCPNVKSDDIKSLKGSVLIDGLGLMEGGLRLGIGGESKLQNLNAQGLLDYKTKANLFATTSEGLAMNLIDLTQLLSNIDDGTRIMTLSRLSALSARISILVGAMSECLRTMEELKPSLRAFYREMESKE